MKSFDRSLEQRREALQKANAIRSWRAGLKREIESRQRTVAEVLAEPPAEAHTMKVFDLLLAAPAVGRVKADRLVRRVSVSPSKTIGGLSERQRADLARLVA